MQVFDLDKGNERTYNLRVKALEAKKTFTIPMEIRLG